MIGTRSQNVRQIIALLLVGLGLEAGGSEIDFGRDVQPILSDRCYT